MATHVVVTEDLVTRSNEYDPVFLPAPSTLEEFLRSLRENSQLLADFFTLQAQVLEGGVPVELSPDSCYCLSTMCKRSADDLHRLG
jgi:hypothetical protein